MLSSKQSRQRRYRQVADKLDRWLSSTGISQAHASLYGQVSQVFPPLARYLCTTIYEWSDTTANPGLAVATINLNSAYRPFAAVANQPMYYDILQQAYKRYRVLRTSVFVEVQGLSQAHTCVLSYSANNDVPASIRRATETRYSVSKLQSPSGAHDVITLSLNKTMMDVVGDGWRDIDFSAEVTASPAQLSYAYITTQPTSAANANLRIRAKVVQETIFSEPEIPASA
jgi:hypothetical protein